MKIYNFIITTFPHNIFIIPLLIIAVIYSFSGIFFGLDFTDSFYHLNQALNPVHEIYLYPFFLSSVIIKGIIGIFGTEVIYLRMVNWLLLFSSMILPFFFLKVERRRPIILLYVAFTLFLYTPFNANILGYDTLSIFINSLLFSVTVFYLKTRKFFLIFVLSLIGAAAILIRLPNVLAIPVISILLIISEGLKKKEWGMKRMKIPGIFIFLTFLIVVGGYSLYYESWKQFILATSNSNSHDLFLLFSNYLRDGLKLGSYIILLLLSFLVYKNFLSNRSDSKKDGILILFFFVCLTIFVGYTKFAVNYSLFLVALAFAMVLIFLYNERREKFSYIQQVLYLFLLFLFINPFGSNTGLLKAYSLLILLPFVLSISGIKQKRFWLLLVAVLIPFSILIKIFGIYEDKSIFALDEKLELGKLSPIRTNPERKGFLDETDIVVKQLSSKGVEVFFYGNKSHIFHYLYPETSLNISSFFQPVDDPAFLEKFEKIFQGKEQVAVFFVNSYPENSSSHLGLMEQEMIKNGFEQVQVGIVKYYLKTSIN